MPDNDLTSDEISKILTELKNSYQNQDDQFNIYLGNLIDSIPLLSLWDICILYARNMIYEDNVPDDIKKDLRLYSLMDLEINSEEELELLKQIQQWLSEQIVKSIDKKEINPKIVGRFIDGKINSKRTYIDDKQIDEWLLCRDICTSIYNDEYGIDVDKIVECIHDFIVGELRIMAVKAYNTDFEIPTDDSRKNYDLAIENSRLRAQIDKTPAHHSIHKSTHGNSERFAKNREQVLGAALCVIIQWSDKCKNSSDKFEATKIAKLIDEKALLFWPTTNEPPLSMEKMEREISKWINKTGK